jgi:hypothetical protein
VQPEPGPGDDRPGAIRVHLSNRVVPGSSRGAVPGLAVRLTLFCGPRCSDPSDLKYAQGTCAFTLEYERTSAPLSRGKYVTRHRAGVDDALSPVALSCLEALRPAHVEGRGPRHVTPGDHRDGPPWAGRVAPAPHSPTGASVPVGTLKVRRPCLRTASRFTASSQSSHPAWWPSLAGAVTGTRRCARGADASSSIQASWATSNNVGLDNPMHPMLHW